ISSLIVDTIGAFGLEAKPILWNKIIGLGIILAGLFVFFYREIRG
ncbi:MAG: DMT family transporter, partial [Helicobacter sp.]|nr:DMT family transporter [Helicobacter sp.]